MATARVSEAHCPICTGLCFGAITLPCGHLTCRKCCRSMLQQHDGLRLTCHVCRRKLPLPRGCSSVNQLIQQLGTDPVVQDLVQQHLIRQGGHKCQVHQDNDATKVCEDCHDYCCDTCSDVHSKQTVTNDHVLRLLSEVSSAPSRPRAGSISSIASDLSIGNMSVSSTESSLGTGNSSLSSTHSSLSVRSLGDLPSPGQSHGKQKVRQWIQEVVKRLQQASIDKHTFVSSLKDAATVIKQIVSVEEEQDKLLKTYTDRLHGCDNVEKIDANTFAIIGSTADIKTTVNMDNFEQRLNDFMKLCQSTSLSSVEKLEALLRDLLHIHGPPSNNTTSTPERTTGHLSITTITATTTSTTDSTTAAAVTTTTTTTTTTCQDQSSNPTTKSSLPSTHKSSALTTNPQPCLPDTVDIMTAIPHKVFVTKPLAQPLISSIVCAQNEKLVMTDYENRKVKVVDMSDPYTVSDSLPVKEIPLHMAALSDGLVAMTVDEPAIYLLKVSPALAVESRIKTNIPYSGVAEGLTDDTLLVCIGKTVKSPATVNIITRKGDLVMPVVNSTTLTQLCAPSRMCVSQDSVLLSDWAKDAVYKVNVSTGQLLDTLTHRDMRRPGQVCVDGEGNIYTVSSESGCVLVMSKQKEWRRIVYSPDHTDQGCHKPLGVCVTTSGRLVVAWCNPDSHCVVIGYELKGLTQQHKQTDVTKYCYRL